MTALQQPRQRRLDLALALPRRQVQDLQIFLDRTLGLLRPQQVISQPKTAAGEQLVPVAVVGERARLAHQPVDNVPVGDVLLAAAAQTRQAFHQTLGIPDLDMVGMQAGLDPLADQSAVHRIGVAADVNGAARIHAHTHPLAGVQTLRRQRLQHRQLLAQPRLPTLIPLLEQLPQERLIRRPADKVAAATQQQCLVQRPLELAMALLHVAVLVRPGRVDGLPLQAVVPQQRLITLLKCRPVAARRHRRRQRIGAMNLRHAAQFGQRILQPRAEALETLGEADAAGLPVRVAQHEVIEQMRKRQTANGDLQARHVREVRSPEPSRLVDLPKEDLLGRSVQRPPLLDMPLQSPQLPLGKTPGVFTLQPGEQGLGLQAGVERQLLLDPRPHVGEGVGPGSPGMLHTHLAGQLAEPPILPCRLVVDPRLGRGLALGQVQLIEAAQPTNVLIGNHPKPPCRKGFG